MSVEAVEGQDVERGKLFEVPRVKVRMDDADPDILKLAFSGSVELDRTNAKQVDFYNRLRAGRETELSITVLVAGAQKRHKLDADGNVDEVVETKGLVITYVHPETV